MEQYGSSILEQYLSLFPCIKTRYIHGRRRTVIVWVLLCASLCVFGCFLASDSDHQGGCPQDFVHVLNWRQEGGELTVI